MPGIEAIVWVDPPIPLVAELAGRSFDVVIGGSEAIVTVPLTGAESLQATANAPVPPRAREYPDSIAQPRNRSHGVGRVQIPTPGGVLALDQVHLKWGRDLTVDERHSTSSVVRHHMHAEITLWLGLVRDWLAAWYGDVSESVSLSGGPLVRLTPVDRPEAGSAYVGGDDINMPYGRTAADARSFEAALRAGSEERELPLAHGLLSEARLHMLRFEYRYVVINSCGAAEVGLSNVVRAHLHSVGHSDSEVKQILRGVTGIVELYRLAAATGASIGVSIERVKGQLAGPRNSAAHDGDLLDQNTAAKSYQTARVLVDLDPLPAPDEVLRIKTQMD